MYENGNKRYTGTSRNGGGDVKENDRVISTMIYCKNFCKCHNVPPVQQ
jgi:hypothetical protein